MNFTDHPTHTQAADPVSDHTVVILAAVLAADPKNSDRFIRDCHVARWYREEIRDCLSGLMVTL